MTPSDWDAFAESWLAELRASSPLTESDAGQSAAASVVGQAVVMMNFTADPDHQWQFIRSAVASPTRMTSWATSQQALSSIYSGDTARTSLLE